VWGIAHSVRARSLGWRPFRSDTIDECISSRLMGRRKVMSAIAMSILLIASANRTPGRVAADIPPPPYTLNPPTSIPCPPDPGKPSTGGATCGSLVASVPNPAPPELKPSSVPCPSSLSKPSSPEASCVSIAPSSVTVGYRLGVGPPPDGSLPCAPVSGKDAGDGFCGSELLNTPPEGSAVVALPDGAAPCPPVASKEASTPTASCGDPSLDSPLDPLSPLAGPPCPTIDGKYAASEGALCGDFGTTNQPPVDGAALPPGTTPCPSTPSKVSSAVASCTTDVATAITVTSGYSITLSASPTALAPGQATTLTARANIDVGPTDYYIEVFDQTVARFIAECAYGTTCTTTWTQTSQTTHNLVAYISGYGQGYPPPNIQATSNVVSVAWRYTVSLTANPASVPPDRSTVLKAYANVDVGPTPYYIEIFDQTAQQFVADCPSGSSCTSPPITQAGGTTRTYVAYVSGYGRTYPPPSIQAAATTSVTWVPWTVYLYASATILAPGATTTLTAYANFTVTGTPQYIEIFDTTTGANVGICNSNAQCGTQVTYSTPQTHSYRAFISGYGTSYPPPAIQASSSFLSVTWVAVTLNASNAYLGVNMYTTLTATANADITTSPYYIDIYDQSTATRVKYCGSGSSCAIVVSESVATSHSFSAYVADAGPSYPPGSVQAVSNSVNVTWMSVRLTADPTYLAPGAPTTLTAIASTDIGQTPSYFIELFDQTTGQFLVRCGSNNSCSVDVTMGPATRTYVAFISGNDMHYPPASLQATSNTQTVTWLYVTLAASGRSVLRGTSVALTATANTDVGPSPYYIEIYDRTTGARVVSCGSTSQCSPQSGVTQSTAGVSVATADSPAVATKFPTSGHGSPTGRLSA